MARSGSNQTGAKWICLSAIAAMTLCASAAAEGPETDVEATETRHPGESRPWSPLAPQPSVLAVEYLEALDLAPELFPAGGITGPIGAHAVIPEFGIIRPTLGASFVLMSTGEAGTGDPQPGVDWGEQGSTDDRVDLTILLQVPPGEHTLTLSYNFLSTEYPEWVGTSFNDVFVAVVEDPLGSREFVRADVNESFFYAASTTRAKGSGFDIIDSSGSSDAGLTGFVTASTTVTGGEVTLRLSIEDVGDGAWDSAVLVDAVRIGTIDVVDPYFTNRNPRPDDLPDLLEDGEWSANPEVLITGGRPVRGVVADGATEVLLRAPVPGPGEVELRIREALDDSSGTLSPMNASTQDPSVRVPVVSTSQGYRALARYRAPDSFVREGNADDELMVSRTVAIEAVHIATDGNLSDLIPLNLELRRPAVVLMHGLWSDSETWKLPFQSDPRFPVVHRGDYRDTNASHFRSNLGEPREEILQAIDAVREQGLAAVRVDYVGHSMGGILGRLHAGRADYRNRDNLWAGDIHRFITLDSPHTGSPLGNLLGCVARCSLPSNVAPKIGSAICEAITAVADYSGHSITRGAIFDLGKGSLAIRTLPEHARPSHALVGTAGQGYTDALIAALEIFLGPLDPLKGQQHDVVVGRDSQEGGLPATAVTLVGTVPDGLHWKNTASAIYSARITELLDMPPDQASFATFPAPSDISSALGVCSWGSWASSTAYEAAMGQSSDFVGSVESVSISTPTGGTTFRPGDTVEILVSESPSGSVDRIVVVGHDSITTDQEPPFSVEVTIPPNVAGPFQLRALGVNLGDGSIAESSPLVLQIIPDAELVGLRIAPADPVIFGVGSTGQIQVVGEFSDQTAATLDPSWFGINFVTDDPSIVSVDGSGRLMGESVGVTTVAALTVDVQASVSVAVVANPDADGDGVRALADCDDSNAAVSPVLIERCDGLDNNCNGLADEDPCAEFDATGNGVIDGEELVWLGRAFGLSSLSPQSEWWHRIDFNHDGIVDGEDLVILATGSVWGRSIAECVYSCEVTE